MSDKQIEEERMQNLKSVVKERPKYFGASTPSLPIKKTPKVKVIDMSKMKQLKLLSARN